MDRRRDECLAVGKQVEQGDVLSRFDRQLARGTDVLDDRERKIPLRDEVGDRHGLAVALVVRRVDPALEGLLTY